MVAVATTSAQNAMPISIGRMRFISPFTTIRRSHKGKRGTLDKVTIDGWMSTAAPSATRKYRVLSRADLPIAQELRPNSRN